MDIKTEKDLVFKENTVVDHITNLYNLILRIQDRLDDIEIKLEKISKPTENLSNN